MLAVLGPGTPLLYSAYSLGSGGDARLVVSGVVP